MIRLILNILWFVLGGWLSGLIFDWTGSYRTAFLHGIAWNVGEAFKNAT